MHATKSVHLKPVPLFTQAFHCELPPQLVPGPSFGPRQARHAAVAPVGLGEQGSVLRHAGHVEQQSAK